LLQTEHKQVLAIFNHIQPISTAEFAQFQRFIFEAAGISMTDAKKALVVGRLGKRLAACGA